jgi:GNAT superfamily N-acetyltransferase
MDGFATYCQCFPDENEREPRGVLEAYLNDPEMNWRMLLATDETGRVVGGRNVNVLSVSLRGQKVRFAWGEHLYVDSSPEFRRRGIGSTIVRETNELLARSGVGLVFSEQNDPFLMTFEQRERDVQSGISPEDRLRFWGKLGYRAINAPYLQPSLKGGLPVRYLRLCCAILNPESLPLSVGYDGHRMRADALLAMVRHFHATFVEDIEADPTCLELKKLLASGPDTVDFIDINCRRIF